MMKKIAVIINDLEHTYSPNVKGGGSVVAKNIIIELLSRNDIDLTVFSGPCDISNIDFKYKIIDIHHYHKEFNDKVDKIIKDEKFDKVISLNIDFPYQNYIIQSQSFKHRCLNIPFLFRVVKSYLSKVKIAIQEQRFKNLNYKFIAVANCVKNDYVKNLGMNPEDIKVVYPATNQFYETYPGITQNNRVKFGIVAGSSANKGGHKFVFTLGILKLLGFDFDAVVIAPKYDSDILYSFLLKLFNLKERVTFLKGQIDMKSFYNSIDCLVLPSKNEAFGLVAIEAMACGRPCLISSSAGVSEIIQPETSFIFNRKSFFAYLKELANICILYKKDFVFYEKYSKNAFEIAKTYTWKNFVNQLIE